MASYLVTGCAGFIGARVSELLLEGGHQVTGIDNRNDAYDVRLKEWRLNRLEGRPGFEFLCVDICDRKSLSDVFDREFDAVINLAARAGVRQSVDDPWSYIDTNVTGTLNLLALCTQFDIKQFVLASTSSLYGASDEQPYREDADSGRPLSPYAASKTAAEALCYTYHFLYGLDVTVLRYFTVYGPAGRPDMSPFRFVQSIVEGKVLTLYGDGHQSRDFTYVDDIARGTVEAARPMGFEVINLGSGRPVALLDVIALIERAVGKTARVEQNPSHAADVPSTWAEISKARRMLEWSPSVPIEDGIDRLARWYVDNRDWAQKIQT